jgi:2,4-dienoyl-CoA reductase-like NADH-dependent reductase (Old Yellow Enzyme family)
MQSIGTSPLFTPFTLKGLTLPNRFVMPGMQRQWCVNGKPISKPVDYYKRRVLAGHRSS